MSQPTPNDLIRGLRQIVGERHVLTREAQTLAYRKGYRFGSGPVCAVVRPGTPLAQFQAFKACVEADVIVIVQAANTGLTGGSTPEGTYDRPVVIISTSRIRGIQPLRNGHQVLCLAGATLHELEQALEPLDREPHSVIGSSCIGASVVGGVCNNSGGALVHRGPAYTEYALFARVTADRRVELVNHLGIALPEAPEAALNRLARGDIGDLDVIDDGRRASSSHYVERLRDVDAATPARFNADPEHLYEASGSAGRVMVIAVRLDTFARAQKTATFYIGSNSADELARLRRLILTTFRRLPVSCEYIHRDAFDLADVYGKDTFLLVERLGTRRLPKIFTLKRRIDAVAAKWGAPQLSDRILQGASRLWPDHLPARMRVWRDRYEHHLILKVTDDGLEEARLALDTLFPSATGAMFECSAAEASKAFLHRFAVASAAIRYQALYTREVGQIIALDIALRRNDAEWFERLPPALSGKIVKAVYYGHFLCHVLHQDYIVRRGQDELELEHEMWALLDERSARYPAEHNVGHLYRADPTLALHYRSLDPANVLNPGIGKTSRQRAWA